MYNSSSSPTLSNVIFSENWALNSGGGMYNGSVSNPVLTNVTFFRRTNAAVVWPIVPAIRR